MVGLREEESLGGEGGVERLVLPAEWDALQLEPHVVKRGGPRDRKGTVESKADFGLAYDVDVTFVPLPSRGASGLDENPIAYIPS
jgi:hypothetical protein